jgi:hypothetical protein
MRRLMRLTVVICCALSAQACAEPLIRLHPPSPPEKEPPPEQQTGWKCESGAWEFDGSDKPHQLDGAAANGPYDKNDDPATPPDDHGSFSVTAFAKPESTLVNGQCYIDTTENKNYKFPVGVAIVRSSTTMHNGVQGWTCSAILPYYTNGKKKPSMPVPGLDHLPHITINAAVTYCYVAGAENSSHPADSSE